jgi:hypothetical protein
MPELWVMEDGGGARGIPSVVIGVHLLTHQDAAAQF